MNCSIGTGDLNKVNGEGKLPSKWVSRIEYIGERVYKSM